MKKHFSSIFLLLISLTANAQFSQGTKMVGGNFTFSSTASKTKNGNTTQTFSRTTDFALEPQFGYFIINRLALGTGVEFGVSKYDSKTDEREETVTTIQLTPFVRYYLQNNVFFQGQVGVGTSKGNGVNDNGSTYDWKENTASWSLAAGYAILLNDFVAIEPMLGYGSTIYKDPDLDSKRMYPGIFLSVGFQIYLP